MTPAVDAVRAAGLEFDLVGYDHDPGHGSYGMEPVELLGLDPDIVFKTLVVSVGSPMGRRQLAMAMLPVAESLDLKAFAGVLGEKRAQMAEPASAERATGYVLGGISPIGTRQPLPLVIDETVELVDQVYFSAGRRGLELVLAPDDLIELTGALVASLTVA